MSVTGKSERKKEEAQKTAELEQAEAKLSEAQAKADEYLDMARRLQADFDNYRRRTQRENEEFRKYAASELVAEVLVTVDDLDRALAIAKDKDSDFVKGIEGVRKNLMKVLVSKGLTEIPTDSGFDPLKHEALCTEEGDTDGEVTEVFQKGYMIYDRILRCSKVRVTKRKEEKGE